MGIVQGEIHGLRGKRNRGGGDFFLVIPLKVDFREEVKVGREGGRVSGGGVEARIRLNRCTSKGKRCGGSINRLYDERKG